MKSLLVSSINLFVLVPLLLLVTYFSCSVSALPLHHGPPTTRIHSVKFTLGEEDSGLPNIEMPEEAELEFVSSKNGHKNSTLILAAARTNRLDILYGFKHYRGGWNITNQHYWASVGFTGAFGFILAVFWFFGFGIVLLVHHCCKVNIYIGKKGSSHCSQRICLILLILFTCAAVVGCIVLSIGQDGLYGEAMHTLKYVVNQSDYSVRTLRNVSEYLSLAKTIYVAQVFLPKDVLKNIDKLNVDLSSAADTLTGKTSKNARKIEKIFNAMQSALITVAIVMLVLSFVGFFLSLFKYRHAIHIFVVSGWLLVATSFVLCGVFAILINAVSDTCLAMNEWVDNPQAETALSSILPCVDQSTTNKTLIQSKKIVNSIVNVVNTYIYTYANADPSPKGFTYYNQSGPSLPPLCSPFDSQLQDRSCGSIEVSIENSSVVWQNYVCKVSSSRHCTTVGRITPDAFGQLVAAVNESHALQHYTPVLLSLKDCKFVRNAVLEITSFYCAPLEKYLRIIIAGLALISVGVLLCLLLWLLYANRPQREEALAKRSSDSDSNSNSNSHSHSHSDTQNEINAISLSVTR